MKIVGRSVRDIGASRLAGFDWAGSFLSVFA
jgi:hypothetical protein